MLYFLLSCSCKWSLLPIWLHATSIFLHQFVICNIYTYDNATYASIKSTYFHILRLSKQIYLYVCNDFISFEQQHLLCRIDSDVTCKECLAPVKITIFLSITTNQ